MMFSRSDVISDGVTRGDVLDLIDSELKMIDKFQESLKTKYYIITRAEKYTAGNSYYHTEIIDSNENLFDIIMLYKKSNNNLLSNHIVWSQEITKEQFDKFNEDIDAK